MAGSIDKFIPYYRKTYIRQKHFHFDPEILKLKDNVYLEGYWQSERYFKDIEDIIRKDFTFKNERIIKIKNFQKK